MLRSGSAWFLLRDDGSRNAGESKTSGKQADFERCTRFIVSFNHEAAAEGLTPAEKNENRELAG